MTDKEFKEKSETLRTLTDKINRMSPRDPLYLMEVEKGFYLALEVIRLKEDLRKKTFLKSFVECHTLSEWELEE